jgi:predicted phage terminase large subunit-like protein
MPALAEQNEGWRDEGDALWPERFPVETLARIREAVGSAAWLALYQQRPVSQQGNIFRRDWFRSYAGPIEFTRTIFSLDCAYKKGEMNDYSVIMILGETKNGFYLRHVTRERLEFPELQARAVGLAEVWKPHAVLIEDAASGQSLNQALKSETKLPILPVKPLGDKQARAHAVSPLVESGRVFLPTEAPWLNDLIDELAAFPAAPHDDQVDAFTQALGYMRGTYFDSAEFKETVRQQNAFFARERRERSMTFPSRPAYDGQMQMRCLRGLAAWFVAMDDRLSLVAAPRRVVSRSMEGVSRYCRRERDRDLDKDTEL